MAIECVPALAALSDALPATLAILDVGKISEATDYVRTLAPEEKSVVQTWLVFEGILAVIYYVLVFLAVFLLGRRIIQAVIAGYREARSQAV